MRTERPIHFNLQIPAEQKPGNSCIRDYLFLEFMFKKRFKGCLKLYQNLNLNKHLILVLYSYLAVPVNFPIGYQQEVIRVSVLGIKKIRSL